MKNTNLPTTPSQGVLDISIDKEVEINGVGMGVLGNGIPYLTQTGLSKVCGVSRIVLQDISSEWAESISTGIFKTSRMIFLKDYLFAQKFNENQLYLQVIKNGVPHYA